jgi:hypothetical protein
MPDVGANLIKYSAIVLLALEALTVSLIRFLPLFQHNLRISLGVLFVLGLLRSGMLLHRLVKTIRLRSPGRKLPLPWAVFAVSRN